MTRFVPKQGVVFEINKPGYEFYIVLRGEVGFYTSANEEEKAEMRRQWAQIEKQPEIRINPSEPRSKSNYPGVPKIEKIINTTVREIEFGIMVANEGSLEITVGVLMKEMLKAGPGYEFGGLALDEEGGRRKATVVALKDTHFIVLNKVSYQNIISLEQNKKKYKMLEILTKTYYFQNVPRQIINTFEVMKRFENYHFGDVIMKWKVKPDTMYIVFEGVVALVREKPADRGKTGFERFLDGTDASKEILIGNPLLSKSYKKSLAVEELCLRESGMTFGEEFIVLDIPAEYQAVARSRTVTVAALSADIVKKKLFHFMPSCRRDFERAVLEKYKLGFAWRKEIARKSSYLEQLNVFKQAPVSKLVNPFLSKQKAKYAVKPENRNVEGAKTEKSRVGLLK